MLGGRIDYVARCLLALHRGWWNLAVLLERKLTDEQMRSTDDLVERAKPK